MIRMDKLLDMVLTEALEEGQREDDRKERKRAELPPIRYNLELIKKKDGKYVWIE